MESGSGLVSAEEGAILSLSTGEATGLSDFLAGFLLVVAAGLRKSSGPPYKSILAFCCKS